MVLLKGVLKDVISSHALTRCSPPLPMNTHNYPGRGLSLSQLVFALNEELKRMTYSPLYVVILDSLRNVVLINSAASLSTQPLKLSATRQLRWRLFTSGGTHSSPSTASRRISFPSFPPTSPLRRTVSVPLLCAVIGVESSSNMARCGHNCSSDKARSVYRPSSNAQKGLHWISSPIAILLLAPSQ